MENFPSCLLDPKRNLNMLMSAKTLHQATSMHYTFNSRWSTRIPAGAWCDSSATSICMSIRHVHKTHFLAGLVLWYYSPMDGTMLERDVLRVLETRPCTTIVYQLRHPGRYCPRGVDNFPKATRACCAGLVPRQTLIDDLLTSLLACRHGLELPPRQHPPHPFSSFSFCLSIVVRCSLHSPGQERPAHPPVV